MIEVVMKSPMELKPYWRNPRNNDETVEALEKYIPVFGFNQPILIDKNNVIIKGHARHIAAMRLGMEEVPCIISGNTDEQNRIDRIADNKVFEVTKWSVSELQDLEVEFDREEAPQRIPHKVLYQFICPYCGATVKVSI